MAYTPTNWANGDVITSEKLNKIEQGIAGSDSGEFYALHTTMTVTPAETEGEEDTITYSNVELREDGLPMWLIINQIGVNNTTFAGVIMLDEYDNESFTYNNGLTVNRSTGEVTPADLGGVGDVGDGGIH